MYYNFRPRVVLNSNSFFYQPINNFLPVNKNVNSFFYYEDFWGVRNRNDIKHIILPETNDYVLFPKNKPKLTIETDLNTFASPFSPRESFFDIGEEVELENLLELEPEPETEPEPEPEPMATLVKGEKRTSLNQTKHHRYRPKSKSPK